jgi:hypothetical protein
LYEEGYPAVWLDALQVLGNSPEGVIEALMMAHGISAAAGKRA